jgi:hypothetical protein
MKTHWVHRFGVWLGWLAATIAIAGFGSSTVAFADDHTPLQNAALNVFPKAMLGGVVLMVVLLACSGFAQMSSKRSDATANVSYADKVIRYGGGLLCLIVVGVVMFTFAK